MLKRMLLGIVEIIFCYFFAFMLVESYNNYYISILCVIFGLIFISLPFVFFGCETLFNTDFYKEFHISKIWDKISIYFLDK